MTLWLAWALAGCASPPHGGPPGEPEPTRSRLQGAISPYLAAHTEDLVSWWPYGTDAYREARASDRPVLLVFGYATCHWCHVLAEESFRDAAIAGFVNEHFVPVLVDREERPDVDTAHLEAARLLTGKGLGWPLVVVASPEGEVVFATTYLPARDGDRGAKVGLFTVLQDLAARWGTDREAMLDRGRALAADLAQGGPPGGPLPPSVWRDAARALGERADVEHGGFRGSPKFPRPVTLDAWSAWSVRHGDPAGSRHAAFTLIQLLGSPLWDPIDGGFHRYTTDAAWRDIHYEKTLTDNAQLGVALLNARRVTPDPAYDAAARRVARFLSATWTGAGLASALDADSPGVDGPRTEGAGYVLSRAELPTSAADELSLPAEGSAAPFLAGGAPSEATRSAASAVRAARPPVPKDEKVVFGWQGLALAFAAREGRELDDPAGRELAARLAAVVGRWIDGGARERALGGEAPALLDDLAFAAEGSLEHFLATGDPAWLDRAARAVALADERFRRPEGGHDRAPPTDPPLPVRPAADEDGPEPPAAATLARVRLRLAAISGDDVARNRVSEDLLAVSGAVRARPASHVAWLRVADALAASPPEVVVVDDVDGALTAALWTSPAPDAVELVVTSAGGEALVGRVPWLEGKVPADGPVAYVCTLGVCQAPATTPDALRTALAAAQR